ncbi:MAG: hypothetical protein ACNA8R_12055 [Nitriliruptoraceae bacterium]
MSEHAGVPPDVEAKLHQLERLLAVAKTVPLSASVMLNRSEIDGIVADLRAALPDELTQARWVVKERDEILERAQIDADEIVAEARAEQQRLVSEQEVVRVAEQEADRIVTAGREQARQLRLEAEDYVDAKLATFEVVLQKTLGAVERGRDKLRGGLQTDALGSDPDDLLDEDEAAPQRSSIDVPLDDDR